MKQFIIDILKFLGMLLLSVIGFIILLLSIGEALSKKKGGRPRKNILTPTRPRRSKKYF